MADLMTIMGKCIDHVQDGMASNRLQLNPTKTERIWLGSSRYLQLDTVPLLLSGTSATANEASRSQGRHAGMPSRQN